MSKTQSTAKASPKPSSQKTRNHRKKVLEIPGVSKPTSSFFIFVTELKGKMSKEEKQGIGIFNTYAGKMWQALTEDQKHEYVKKFDTQKRIYNEKKRWLEEKGLIKDGVVLGDSIPPVEKPQCYTTSQAEDTKSSEYIQQTAESSNHSVARPTTTQNIAKPVDQTSNNLVESLLQDPSAYFGNRHQEDSSEVQYTPHFSDLSNGLSEQPMDL